jgi:cytochrome c oxidase cbb3-type subunit 4
MDLNTLRIAVTLLSAAMFIGIVIWAWSRRQQARFAEAAQLPFVEDAAQLPFVEEAEERP